MKIYENFKEKMALSAFTVLGIGIALLVFTFISAFTFLAAGSQVTSTQDLVQNFGQSLGWLITTSIRVMYLGVMGWIGSLITIRGVNLITSVPKTEAAVVQTPQEPQQAKAKPEKEAKQEVTPTEPELVAIPLEEMEQQQQ
jgi:hypothetical protein